MYRVGDGRQVARIQWHTVFEGTVKRWTMCTERIMCFILNGVFSHRKFSYHIAAKQNHKMRDNQIIKMTNYRHRCYRRRSRHKLTRNAVWSFSGNICILCFYLWASVAVSLCVAVHATEQILSAGSQYFSMWTSNIWTANTQLSKWPQLIGVINLNLEHRNAGNDGSTYFKNVQTHIDSHGLIIENPKLRSKDY